MLDPARIEEGMTVLDCRGKKVGWVLGVGHGHLHVGRGWLSVKDYFCQLERVAEVRGDQVVLDCPRGGLARASPKDECHYVSGGTSPGLLPEKYEERAAPEGEPAKAPRRGPRGRPRILQRLWGHQA